MSAARDRSDNRKSAARARAEQHSSGVTTVERPDGMPFWDPEPGLQTIDIIPFFAGKGPNGEKINPFASPGMLYFERTFYTYRDIGPEEKAYVCLSKTFGKRDPIQEFRQKEARNPNADTDYLKSLEPKERQIFLVYDHKAKEKGIQLWEVSYHLFGKKLDSRIKGSPESRGWDMFYYPDKDGFTLEINFVKQSRGGYNFLEADSIDFISRREALPDSLQPEAHKICLDTLLVETQYEEMKRIFLGLPIGSSVPDGDDAPQGNRQTESDRETRQERREEPEPRSEERREETNGKTESLTPEQLKRAGYDCFVRGKKRADNPWKKGTDQYDAWQEGWMDAAENEPAQKKEETVTAKTRGIEKGAVVGYRGQKHEVIRIADDGLTVNLMDPADEVVKGVAVAELSKWNGEKAKETAKEEPRKEAAKDTKQAESAAAGGGEEDWDKDWA